MNLLKISWWNDYDLGDILYQDGFRNVIYLDVEVEKPEYNTTIESDLNGDNVEISKFRKWEKVYKFEFWGQEDLVDAFTLMQIHDNIEVTLQSGDVIQVLKNSLKAEPAWEQIGCLAKISVSFAEDYIVAGNCNENMNVECYCADPGEFDKLDDVANKSTWTFGHSVLWFDTEDIQYKKYTATLQTFNTNAQWVDVIVNQYECYTNLGVSIGWGTGTVWFYDGQFWHLFPGYLISLAWTGVGELTVTAYILPGTFGTVYLKTPADAPEGPGGGIWDLTGVDYTADELAAGVVLTGLLSQSYDVRIDVWNHTCGYGYTEQMGIETP